MDAAQHESFGKHRHIEMPLFTHLSETLAWLGWAGFGWACLGLVGLALAWLGLGWAGWVGLDPKPPS